MIPFCFRDSETTKNVNIILKIFRHYLDVKEIPVCRRYLTQVLYPHSSYVMLVAYLVALTARVICQLQVFFLAEYLLSSASR